MRIRLVFIVTVVSVFLLRSLTLAQKGDVELTIDFVKKGHPIERKFLGKMHLNVRYSISNSSNTNLMIPVIAPRFLLLKPSGDTLKCVLNDPKFVPVPTKFNEISFIQVPSMQRVEYVTDVLEGCEFSFGEGVQYTLIGEFQSVFSGTIEILGESTRIWKGTVRSRPIYFVFQD